MNADTKNIILTIALEAAQLELERTKMRLEDQQSKVVESTDKLIDEVSFLASHLESKKYASEEHQILYEAVCDALEVLDPGNPLNYGSPSDNDG